MNLKMKEFESNTNTKHALTLQLHPQIHIPPWIPSWKGESWEEEQTGVKKEGKAPKREEKEATYGVKIWNKQKWRATKNTDYQREKGRIYKKMKNKY